ncbi:MAG: GGDEF domain-containing protein [Ruminococcus sp.]|nr:GGDEF domain-containing protein [Ruminococcus sp.]
MIIRNVAAVVSGMDEEYPYQIIMGINSFAREHNINVSYFAAFGGIIDSKDFDAGEYSIYELPDFSSFDGVLLLSNTFSDPEIRNAIIDKVKASGQPAVIFECKEHEEFYDVSINNYSVMKKLVEHLIKVHGARVFNFISGPEANPEAKDRYRAFLDALAENGIEFDEENRFFQGYFRSYDGIRAIEEFERSGMSLPDVFVCANDSMALTAMSRLQQAGVRIPEDVLITGFDNTFNAQNSCPVLTTVKRPLYYSGEKACGILIDLMNGNPQPRSTEPEAEPVFSESCGCVDNEIKNFRNFRRDTYRRIERTYTNVHMLNRLIAGLSRAESIEDCINSIKRMLDIIGCKDFALCLVSDWETNYNVASLDEDRNGYPMTMTAPLVLENGVRYSVKSFPAKQLFPMLPMTGGNISYFLPLHFNRRCLGYYVMTNSDFPISSLLCHTMTMCIGNAVDNLSKLNVLDPLCRIYNRHGFNKNADNVFRECVSAGSPMSICFIDLDGLKMINDNYGHKEGDFAIKSIADAIVFSCKSTGICGRFGGDEFVAVGRGDGFIEGFLKNMSEAVEELNERAGKPYRISASMGHLTVIPTKNDELFDLIQQADCLMYENKKKRAK